MEIAALVMSIISLLASIGLTIWQIITTNKNNRINIDKDAFNIIFNADLIKEIPQARKYIKFNAKNELTGIKILTQKLHGLLKDALYFNYHAKMFYDELDGKIQELDDYLTNNSMKKFEGSRQIKVLQCVDSLIEDLYSIIYKKKTRG